MATDFYPQQNLLNLSAALEIFEPVIGLEVHTQLNTVTKMWCHCEISKTHYENHTVCEICSAQPGSLPTINQHAVSLATKAALAVNCEIQHRSTFDRKNYFYPDLPKGYQITQFFAPLAKNGYLTIHDAQKKEKKITIQRIQMEEDTGKSTHHQNYSLINLNRCGTPLIEIISAPDLSSAEEASAYLKKLHQNLVYLNVTKGNLQDGNFRCDVNLSLRKIGEKKFGTRTEVKNLNSFRNVEKAIEYEITRQATHLLHNNAIPQQTLLFDMTSGITRPLRTKTDADDYRYIPEPDLTPIILTDSYIQKIKESLPELPDAKEARLKNQYGLSDYDAQLLCQEKALADFFEQACEHYPKSPKKIANWVISELLHFLKEAHQIIEKSPVTPKSIAELVKLIEEDVISGKIGKEIFIEMYDHGTSPLEIVDTKNLRQTSDTSQLEEIIQRIVAQNPSEVAQLKSGRDRMMGFFVGQVMKETGGAANPKLTSELVKKIIGKM